MAFAQKNDGRQITGKLLDAQTKEPLIGATIAVKGTTTATSASLDGSFKLNVPAGADSLEISYIGYVSQTVAITGNDLGVISVNPTSASIKEVVVTANTSLAIDRQTPIAVSTIGAQYIEEKGANAEFPELLKAAPGVMTSRNGGGYGDSRVSIRGFSSNNVALLINGIPVNDVETGKLFWNDWAGLSDVTTSMQVQRGLGASTVAVPSLGGTINIATKSTETQEGGAIMQSVGSYGMQKTMINYATGLSDKGWGASFLLSRSKSDGNFVGGNYLGYSYFANISKVISSSQTLSFNAMGAWQTHNQRFTRNSISTYRTSPDGIRFNSDYGYLNGQLYSAEQNYYNKPLASINHNWQINDKSSLATVVYGSWGLGAARYLTGANVGLMPGGTIPRTGDKYSPIDFNQIVKNNLASPDGSALTYMQDDVNDHSQYGVLSTYKRQIGDINLLAGVDARYYTAEKYFQVDDLLGGSYILNQNKNTPNTRIGVGGKFSKDYKPEVASEGIFLQGEYVKDDLSAFITLAANNTSNRRTDYYNYLNTDAGRVSKWVNFLGYQSKAGANYNIDSHNNVFANVGYLQRAPLFGSIFPNTNNGVNSNAIPEKLMSYELGYGYRSAMFSANVNLYRSTYKDRSKNMASPTQNNDGTIDVINISGINELHQGVEVDAKFRPINDVTLSGSFSYGDYHYLTNTGQVIITKQDGTSLTQPSLFLKGLKIGEPTSPNNSAAQTTAALGLDVKVLPQLKIGSNYNFYGRYYATYNPTFINSDRGFDKLAYTNYQLPNFSTVDLNIVFRFKFAGLDASFIGNVNNLLNTVYLEDAFETISDATTANANFVTRTNALGVYYGAGRTYSTTLKIRF